MIWWWFQYLLDVWHWKKLLQSGQEVQHQHLQSAVILGTKVRGKNILEQIITSSVPDTTARHLLWSDCFTCGESQNTNADTHLEKALPLLRVFHQQFHLIHKVRFWKLDLREIRLEPKGAQITFKHRHETKQQKTRARCPNT